jgi:homocysteine S-methyltransferase
MPLSQILARQGFVVLDGGLATELEAKGADLHDPLWSAKALLETPDMLEQVNYEYLCAGADIATSASYQATIPGLMSKGLTAPQAEAAIRKSVEISRHARDRFWSRDAMQKENRWLSPPSDPMAPIFMTAPNIAAIMA